MRAKHYILSGIFIVVGFLAVYGKSAAAVDVPVKTIVKEQFAVGPGRYNVYKIDVNLWLLAGKLSGVFNAYGGTGNDIEVFIVDENGYALWQKGNAVFTYYSSGRVSSGSIDVSLSKGIYYMVFSNIFSIFSTKTVLADIYLYLPIGMPQ